MNSKNTALLLIGFQNDYFASDGILRAVIEKSSSVTHILENTTFLIQKLLDSCVPIVATPIVFTDDYRELDDEPVGILKNIKDVGAFKVGTHGSETISQLKQFGSRIECIPGKHGLNAFSNTQLNDYLRGRKITNLVLAGTVTSICIDSTGRSAHERGFKVHILSDCTSSRTIFEQEFYCSQIFPLYANVLDHKQLLTALGIVH